MCRLPPTPCGSEPAREDGGSASIHFECATAIASKLGSHRSGGVPGCAGCPQSPVGASLLAKTVGQLASILNVLPPSRASSAPTGPVVYPDVPVVPQSPVGASLLAKTVGQLASILNVLPPSRASSAPTGPMMCLDVPVAPNPLWEPSLLAKTVGQLASILNVLPPSRASSAPTGPMMCLDVPVAPNPLWERACSRRRWVSLHPF